VLFFYRFWRRRKFSGYFFESRSGNRRYDLWLSKEATTEVLMRLESKKKRKIVSEPSTPQDVVTITV